MRVSIIHTDKTAGLFGQVKQVEVAVTVTFSEEEQAIIRNRKLKDYVVIERQPDSRSASKLTPEYIREAAAAWHLRVKHLATGKPDRFTFDTPIDAKRYEADLTAQLKVLKGFLEGNAETGASTTFEL